MCSEGWVGVWTSTVHGAEEIQSVAKARRQESWRLCCSVLQLAELEKWDMERLQWFKGVSVGNTSGNM